MSRKKRSRNPPASGRPRSLRSYWATVVGLNAVGRTIAHLLASSGIGALQLVDHRVVSRRSQRREGFAVDDIGRLRVHAVGQRCHEIAPTLDIGTLSRRKGIIVDPGDVVFWCALPLGNRLPIGRNPVPVIRVRVAGTEVAIDDDNGETSYGVKQGQMDSTIMPHIAAFAAGLAIHGFQGLRRNERTPNWIRWNLDKPE